MPPPCFDAAAVHFISTICAMAHAKRAVSDARRDLRHATIILTTYASYAHVQTSAILQAKQEDHTSNMSTAARLIAQTRGK